MSRSQNVSPTDGQGFGGRHVLGAMLAFFAVIVVADATMIYKAVSTFGGVENANAYREGLAYNTRIARAEQQAALGWQDNIEVTAHPARLRVALSEASGAPVGDVSVTAMWGRPATNRADKALLLSEVAPGVFEAPLAEVGSGTWVATVRVARGADPTPVYQTRRRVWIAP